MSVWGMAGCGQTAPALPAVHTVDRPADTPAGNLCSPIMPWEWAGAHSALPVRTHSPWPEEHEVIKNFFCPTPLFTTSASFDIHKKKEVIKWRIISTLTRRTLEWLRKTQRKNLTAYLNTLEKADISAEKLWNRTAHHRVRSEATGGANLIAAQPSVCVTLTHTFHVILTHLQHQTQLLREQSLHHWGKKEKRARFILKRDYWLTDFDIQMSYRPPTPSKGKLTSIPRFPAKAISSRQEMSPPSLTSCPALSRRSTTQTQTFLDLQRHQESVKMTSRLTKKK